MSLQASYEKHQKDVDYFWIYISEAHATDDARPSQTVKIAEHKTIEERTEVASNCASELKLSIPQLVDDMENTVATAYNGHPDRLFVLSPEGKVAYAGGKGPHGFHVDEMETALSKLLKETK